MFSSARQSNTWIWVKLEEAVGSPDQGPAPAEARKTRIMFKNADGETRKNDAAKEKNDSGRVYKIDTSYLKPLAAAASRFVIRKD